MTEEKTRVQEHFQRLLSAIQNTSAIPIDMKIYQQPIDHGYPRYSSSNIMMNRLTAEISRKHSFASIYSGPISNSPEIRCKFAQNSA